MNWLRPNCDSFLQFGRDQFILVVTISFWSRPNHYGQVQINLVRPKPFWTDQNCFGDIEGQGIIVPFQVQNYFGQYHKHIFSTEFYRLIHIQKVLKIIWTSPKQFQPYRRTSLMRKKIILKKMVNIFYKVTYGTSVQLRCKTKNKLALLSPVNSPKYAQL